MNPDHESLAAIELERHRPQMLYAERQLLKKGEYDKLARSLVKRSRVRLWCGVAAGAVVALSSGHWFHVAWGVAIFCAALLDYSHTQRTLSTIRTLEGADER